MKKRTPFNLFCATLLILAFGGMLMTTASCCEDEDAPAELSENCIDSTLMAILVLCSPEADWVCGCNGKSYKNECWAWQEGVAEVTPGKCHCDRQAAPAASPPLADARVEGHPDVSD